MSIVELLNHKLINGIKVNEPMADHTSWQVGGPADYYVSPVGLDELVEVLSVCCERKIPALVIGNGTNLLVLDGGIRGMVINIGPSFSYVKPVGEKLIVGAGTPMTLLAFTAAEESLSGLEFTVGIPGSLGGAVIMNAGAFGGYIGEKVGLVRLVNLEGKLVELKRDELEFGYRTSNLIGKGVVYEIELNLTKGEQAVSKRQIDYFLAERQRRHPNLPSAGSVFRNLPDQPAGQIIEQAGAKGICIGGAEVSTQHANFIVNTGKATAADVLKLIKTVQALVKEQYGLELKPEVKIVGEELAE
ncbi:MAG: UDP-N-acetylmuramate dehydrogenase [Firmicutes bacterium]|nr:UDP-N-acetylmuramate dehydrogenase [Bacillota bacterium]